jgi:hypothetical protein
MKTTLREETMPSVLPNTGNGEPSVETAADILDWDVNLPVPPRRPQGLIQVRLIYQGRSQPVPVADPGAE